MTTGRWFSFAVRFATAESATTKLLAAAPATVAFTTRLLSTAALMCWFTACGSSPDAHNPATPAHPLESAATTTAPPATVLEKQSTCDEREAALAELAPLLASELSGPGWTPLFQRAPLFGADWSTWLSQNNVVQADPTTGRFAAKLDATQVERVLAEFDRAALPVQQLQMPVAWYPALLPALNAERRWSVCQRRQQWLSVQCAEPAPLDARLMVSNLAAGLSLEPLFPDGVPVRANGEMLWPVEFRVVQRSEGQLQVLSGVPVAWPPNAAHVTSDDSGVCRFPPAPLSNGEPVRVAADALLGPFAELVEIPEVTLTTRPLDLARHAVVEITSGSSSPTPTNANFASALGNELAAAFARPSSSLPQSVTLEVQRDAATSIASPLLSEVTRTHLVNATRGALDYVVLTSASSEFASQMGVDRTWYETRARVKVVEVWSGAVVAEFEEKAMGSGIGDSAAEAASRSSASHQVAARLRALRLPQ